MKVFLGGTCNNSTWRDTLIPMLTIDCFNPVVEDWTPGCQEEEIKQRKECDYVLYCITPRMEGFYSIAEVVDDSNKRPAKTIFCVLDYAEWDYNPIQFTEKQIKSLIATSEMIKKNGATVLTNLSDVASFLNSKR